MGRGDAAPGVPRARGRQGAPAPRRGLVIAGYGTASAAARERDLEPFARAVEGAWRRAHPGCGAAAVEAYVSDPVRAKLARGGVSALSVDDALAGLHAQGCTEVDIATSLIVAGESFARLAEAACRWAPRFERLHLARPLLDGPRDARVLAAALADRCEACAGRVVVCIAHGAAGAGERAYALLGEALAGLGRADVLFGQMHGAPGLDEVLAQVAANAPSVRSALLVPVMVACGAHAAREIAGADEASWASRLRAAGIEVAVARAGLGSMSAVQRLAVEHLLG